MSPKTEHTTCLDEAPPVLDVNEPSANYQLVPVNTAAPSGLSTVNAEHSVINAVKQPRRARCPLLRPNAFCLQPTTPRVCPSLGETAPDAR
jgi:hypothetical protein